MFTESNVANDRICCSLHGNRVHNDEILNSFGNAKRAAIMILRTEGTDVVTLVKSRRISGETRS
jgi:hypothetical protein